MSELLIELFSEEIPAKLQNIAIKNFCSEILQRLNEKLDTQIKYEYWISPQRMGMFLSQIPNEQKISVQEIRGPKTNAPKVAIDGFLKKNNLEEKDLYTKENYYFSKIILKSETVVDFLKTAIEDVLNKFVWKKSMHWGEHDITWIRPLHNILCLFDNNVLQVKFGHIIANDNTYGHRFISNIKLKIDSFQAYKKLLVENYVILDPQKRSELILSQAEKLLAPKGLTLLIDEELLEEVVGLIEYPVIYLAEIDIKFMSLPKEVLITTLKSHQKYLMVINENKELAPYYIIVANTITEDNGEEVVRGNTKVLQARLEDAKFHYESDLKQKLEDRIEALKKLTYHQKLGSVFDKMQSVLKIAEKIALALGLDIKKIARALMLSKADLVSNMVKEFPELQGIMGYYYALHDKEDKEIAIAIKEHYKPQGPSDSLPSTITGAIVAVADKLDTLNQMFAINIKPTGSKDPYALRRAAIGILRICNRFNIHLDYQKLGVTDDVAQFIKDKGSNQSI